MNFDEKLKFTSFLLQISEWERQAECIRQVLNGLKDFEPYAAFTRVARENFKGKISAEEIQFFLSQNSHEIPLQYCEQLIKMYDTNFDGELAFDEFLMMVLARDNPDLRFSAAQRENYEVDFSQKLSVEIEYTLTRLFLKEIDYISKTCNDIVVFTNLEAIFQFLDQNKSKHLDYENLKQFFVDVNIMPLEEELVCILRKMDVDDDGRITLPEFLYFMSVFKPSGVSQELKQEMTQQFRNYQIQPHNRSPIRSEANKQKMETQLLDESNANGRQISNNSLEGVSAIQGFNQTQPGFIGINDEFTTISQNMSTNNFQQNNEQKVKRAAPRLNSTLEHISAPKQEQQKVQGADKTLYVYNHQQTDAKNNVNEIQFTQQQGSHSFRAPTNQNSQQSVIKRSMPRTSEKPSSSNSETTQHKEFQLKYGKHSIAGPKAQTNQNANFDSMYIENNLNYSRNNLNDSIEKRASPIRQQTEEGDITIGLETRSMVQQENNFQKKAAPMTQANRPNSQINASSKNNEKSDQQQQQIYQGMGTGSRDNNPKLVQALGEMIEIEKSIEGAKQELALRPDYNLKDHFRSVDTLKKGSVNFKSWQLFLSKLKVAPLEKQALSERLFAIADLDQDSVLNLKEFSDFFQPIQQEYKVLLGCRVEKSQAGNFDFEKLFTVETKRIMRSVLHYMLESVRVANQSKDNLGLSENELLQLFAIIDADQDGVISIGEMSEYLVKNKLMVTKREMSLLFNRLDIDKDQVISQDEFLSWLHP